MMGNQRMNPTQIRADRPVRRWLALLSGMTLVAAAATFTGVGPSVAGADEDTTGAPTASGSAWAAEATGRVFEPYAEIPHAFYPGAPMAEVHLYSPGNCDTWAAAYYAGVEVEEAILQPIPNYNNVTLARATNPEGAVTPTKSEVAPLGPAGGPRYLAECPLPHSGHGFARDVGFQSQNDSFAGGMSDTKASIDEATRVLVSETTTALDDLNLNGLHIQRVVSWLKTELSPGAEPKVSYRIELFGITAPGKEGSASSAPRAVALGGTGLTLSGKDVGGSDLVRQFNAQATAHEQDLAALGRYGLRILEPKVTSDDDFHTVEAPVMDAGMYFTARQNQTGQGQALRFAMARFRGSYTKY
jgi:hypothetical protein